MAAGRDTAADSRFGVTELDELPDDLRERIGVIAEKSGFMPNIFRALGRLITARSGDAPHDHGTWSANSTDQVPGSWNQPR